MKKRKTLKIFGVLFIILSSLTPNVSALVSEQHGKDEQIITDGFNQADLEEPIDVKFESDRISNQDRVEENEYLDSKDITTEENFDNSNEDSSNINKEMINTGTVDKIDSVQINNNLDSDDLKKSLVTDVNELNDNDIEYFSLEENRQLAIEIM